MLLQNTFEGGSDGVAISTGNSGGASGSAFETINLVAGGVLAYDTAQAMHGTTSMEFSTGATTGQAWVQWVASFGTLTDFYGRFYLRLSAAPLASSSILNSLSGATGRGRIQLTTGRILRFLTLASTNAGAMTQVLALNTWYRVEFFMHLDAVTGSGEMRLYLGDSTSLLDSCTAGPLDWGGSADRIRLGCVSTQPNFPQTWADDFGVTDVTWLGPALVTHDGAAALTAASGLTTAGVQNAPGAAALTAASGFTASGLQTAVAALDLSAASGLTTAGVQNAHGLVAMSAGSGLAVAGVQNAPGAVNLSAASGLTAAGVVTADGAVDLTAASDLTAGAVRTGHGALAMTAGSGLSTAGLLDAPATVNLSASSALVAAGVPNLAGAVLLEAATVLATAADAIEQEGAVAFTAASGLTAAATTSLTGAAPARELAASTSGPSLTAATAPSTALAATAAGPTLTATTGP